MHYSRPECISRAPFHLIPGRVLAGPDSISFLFAQMSAVKSNWHPSIVLSSVASHACQSPYSWKFGNIPHVLHCSCSTLQCVTLPSYSYFVHPHFLHAVVNLQSSRCTCLFRLPEIQRVLFRCRVLLKPSSWEFVFPAHYHEVLISQQQPAP